MIRHNILANSVVAQQFVAGITRLKDPQQFPWPNQPGLSIYDVFVFWHHQTMMMMTPPTQRDRNAAHSGPAFLPWHRYFLLRLEGFLQQAVNDPDFRLPYWDWSADADLPNPSTSPLWDMSNLGQFVGSGFEVRLTFDPITNDLQRVSRQLQRDLGAVASLPTRQQVVDTLRFHSVYDMAPFNSSSPSGMRNPLEGWIGSSTSEPPYLHNRVHVWVGGDMSWSSSPNDPAFFLNHCNIDRLWSSWQEKNPNAAYQPDMSAPASLQFHRVDDPLYSVFNEQVTPRDMVKYRDYYEYDSLVTW